MRSLRVLLLVLAALVSLASLCVTSSLASGVAARESLNPDPAPATNQDLLELCLAKGRTAGSLAHLRTAFEAIKSGNKMKPDGSGTGTLLWAGALTRFNAKVPPPTHWKPLVGELKTYLANLWTRPFDRTVKRKGTIDGTTEEATDRWTYTLGDDGEVTRVTGYVRNGPSTNAAKEFNDAHFRFSRSLATAYPNTVPSDDRANVESGHIVASSLGGTNSAIINFFPQSGWSNRGPYKLAEDFASWMRSEIVKAKAANAQLTQSEDACVKIDVSLVYPSSVTWPISLVPERGMYTVTWDDACLRVGSAKLNTLSCNWDNPIAVRGPTHVVQTFDPRTAPASCQSVALAGAAYLAAYPAVSAVSPQPPPPGFIRRCIGSVCDLVREHPIATAVVVGAVVAGAAVTSRLRRVSTQMADSDGETRLPSRNRHKLNSMRVQAAALQAVEGA